MKGFSKNPEKTRTSDHPPGQEHRSAENKAKKRLHEDGLHILMAVPFHSGRNWSHSREHTVFPAATASRERVVAIVCCWQATGGGGAQHWTLGERVTQITPNPPPKKKQTQTRTNSRNWGFCHLAEFLKHGRGRVDKRKWFDLKYLLHSKRVCLNIYHLPVSTTGTMHTLFCSITKSA